MSGMWILSTDARRPTEKDEFKSFYIKLKEGDTPLISIWKYGQFWTEQIALTSNRKRGTQDYLERSCIRMKPVVKFHSFLYR